MSGAAVGRLGVIVLAGGASRRFGRDKLAEPIDGRALLDHAIEAARRIDTAVDVLVVAAPDAMLPVPGGVRVVHDEVADAGPLAGLIAGLTGLDPAIERVVVVGGDMPDLVPAVLGLLAATLDDADVDASLLEVDQRVRALPMAVRRGAALPAARALFASGDRRLRSVPLGLGAAIVPAVVWRALDPTGATLRDIDTVADLAAR